MTDDLSARRPLKTRQQRWAHVMAHKLVSLGMTPNQMSVAGVQVAALGAVFLLTAGSHPLALIGTAICIQLRLLSNMLDGLMAVEEGKKSPTGALYNEVPDRIADSLFLVAAGYAAALPGLGWFAALLAVMTAYVRALGASLGTGHDFSGPMAKPHRMFALTVTCLLAALIPSQPIMMIGLMVIAAGTAVTLGRRLYHAAQALKAAAHAG